MLTFAFIWNQQCNFRKDNVNQYAEMNTCCLYRQHRIYNSAIWVVMTDGPHWVSGAPTVPWQPDTPHNITGRQDASLDSAGKLVPLRSDRVPSSSSPAPCTSTRLESMAQVPRTPQPIHKDGLKTTGPLSLTVLEARSPRSRPGRAASPPKALVGVLLISSSFWRLLGALPFHGLQTHHSRLCLWGHTASPGCQRANFSLAENTCHRSKAHPTHFSSVMSAKT